MAHFHPLKNELVLLPSTDETIWTQMGCSQNGPEKLCVGRQISKSQQFLQLYNRRHGPCTTHTHTQNHTKLLQIIAGINTLVPFPQEQDLFVDLTSTITIEISWLEENSSAGGLLLLGVRIKLRLL